NQKQSDEGAAQWHEGLLLLMVERDVDHNARVSTPCSVDDIYRRLLLGSRGRVVHFLKDQISASHLSTNLAYRPIVERSDDLNEFLIVFVSFLGTARLCL